MDFRIYCEKMRPQRVAKLCKQAEELGFGVIKSSGIRVIWKIVKGPALPTDRKDEKVAEVDLALAARSKLITSLETQDFASHSRLPYANPWSFKGACMRFFPHSLFVLVFLAWQTAIAAEHTVRWIGPADGRWHDSSNW